MAKAAASPEETILAGLRKALSGTKKLLVGKGGFYAAGKADAANAAVAASYLTTEERTDDKGKKKVYAAITDKGIRRVDDEDILAGLRTAVESLPESKPMCGAGGLYTQKQGRGKKLGETAVDEKFLDAKEQRSGRGTKVFAVITEKGIRRVLDAESPKPILTALLPAVQAMGESAATLLRVLQQAVERVETPKLPGVVSSPEAASPVPDGKQPEVLEQVVVSFVNEWAKAHHAGCPLNKLIHYLREKASRLTIGEFHDILRKLHKERRLRLTGWGDSVDRIPDPDLAIVVSSEVMYYVEPVAPGR